MNHFFAYIDRMRYIERWALMRNSVRENIQEHSHQVAVLAHALAVIRNEKFGGHADAGAVAVAALYHDASEILTGDMPTPIKYDNPAIRKAYKEVEAVAEESPDGQLFFVPAFPQMNRTTEHGQQLIEGMPVAQSVFGQDPFEPVRNSDVAAIIAEQSGLPTVTAEPGEPIRLKGPGIQICDAKSVEDIRRTGEVLRQNGKLRALAGCAGFAAILPGLLGLERTGAARQPRLDKRLLVICGSVNPITLSQLDEAEQNGFLRLRLTPEEKLEDHYWETPAGREKLKAMAEAVSRSDCIIIDTNDADGNRSTRRYAEQRQMKVEEMRQRIADSIGRTAKYLIEADGPGAGGTCRTLMITGGDVLIQTMGELGVAELHPICEMDPGVVLSSFTCRGQKRYVLSKSGGFGPSDQLLRILNKLNRTIEE